MLEDRDGGKWEDTDPNDTISACVATANYSSEGLPYYNKIEWANTSGGKAMRMSGFHFPNEIDKASQCFLYRIKTRFYCLGCLNKNKPNQVAPLFQVKRCSNLAKNTSSDMHNALA